MPIYYYNEWQVKLLIQNHHNLYSYTPVEKGLRKKVQKQVKKKAFKINAKIEVVGLNED